MELLVSVNFRGALAHFKIRVETSGICFATLERYDGDKYKSPPKEITLMRGVRQWTGSNDDQFLLFELGKAIDDRLRESPIEERGKYWK
jgi:hypothetical protein